MVPGGFNCLRLLVPDPYDCILSKCWSAMPQKIGMMPTICSVPKDSALKYSATDTRTNSATTSSETWSGTIRPWTCGSRSSNLKRDITAQPWTFSRRETLQRTARTAGQTNAHAAAGEPHLKRASPHLRVGIILLVQTGGRTHSEGFRLRWDQVDWEHRLIHFGNDVKTPGSSEPLPLTDLAFRVLQKWKEQSRSDSPYIFPSLRKPGAPVGSAKTTWRTTLRRAGAPRFPIYNLRYAFCTRLSWVAPDAVIERAMRYTSPETKRIDQLSMVSKCAKRWRKPIRRCMAGASRFTDAFYMTLI